MYEQALDLIEEVQILLLKLDGQLLTYFTIGPKTLCISNYIFMSEYYSIVKDSNEDLTVGN